MMKENVVSGNVDGLHQAPQGAVLNPFAQLNATVMKLVRPVAPGLFKIDEAGKLAVVNGDKAVRYDIEAKTAVDVTGTVISVPEYLILAIPGTQLKPGEQFINNDKVFACISDDGHVVQAYDYVESKISNLVPTQLAIAPDLRDIQKVVFLAKEIFGDALEGVVMSSLMTGKTIDFSALLQGKLIKDLKVGGGNGDFAKFAMFSALGQQAGPGANFQSMLPLLFMNGGSAGEDMKTFAMLSMMQQGGAAGAATPGVQNMLPLLFLGGKSGSGSLLPLVMCMAMSGTAEGMGPMQALLPLMLLKKKEGCSCGGGLFGGGDTDKLFLMMMCMGGAAQGGMANMLPLFLLKDGLFGGETPAATATDAPATVPDAPAEAAPTEGSDQ